jgi:RNA polymerase sigma-70 factor (ECF subfamily)
LNQQPATAAERDEEAALVERARRGDERAWRWLHATHRNRVYTVVRRIVGEDDLANDVTQEVWIRVVQRLGTFEGKSAFRTWVTTVATRIAYDTLRARKPSEELAEDTAAEHSREDRILTTLTLQQALDRLPVGYRTVIQMRKDGYSYEEIAAALDIMPVTARTQFHTGIAYLARLLPAGT